MNEKTLKDLKKIAINNLKRDDCVLPMYILESRNKGMVVIQADFSDINAKVVSMKRIKVMLESGNFKSFFHVSEAWAVMGDDLDLENVIPSEHPNRIEVVFFTYKQDDGSGYVSQIPFVKVGDKYQFREEKKFESDKCGELGGPLWDVWK